MTAGGVTDNNERLGRKAMAPRDLRALLQMTPMPYWATTTLIGLGLAASLAETLGISRRRVEQTVRTGGIDVLRKIPDQCLTCREIRGFAVGWILGEAVHVIREPVAIGVTAGRRWGRRRRHAAGRENCNFATIVGHPDSPGEGLAIVLGGDVERQAPAQNGRPGRELGDRDDAVAIRT
jgi:hypothetical protein